MPFTRDFQPLRFCGPALLGRAPGMASPLSCACRDNSSSRSASATIPASSADRARLSDQSMAASPLMLEARYRSYPRALAHSLVVPTLRIGPGPSFALGQDLLSHWRVVDDPTARQVYCVLCCLPTGPFGPP